MAYMEYPEQGWQDDYTIDRCEPPERRARACTHCVCGDRAPSVRSSLVPHAAAGPRSASNFEERVRKTLRTLYQVRAVLGSHLISIRLSVRLRSATHGAIVCHRAHVTRTRA